jgi:predicted small secreted protein
MELPDNSGGFWSEVRRVGRRRANAGNTMNKTVRFKAATFAGLVVVSMLAAACNTVEGAGKDTQNLGKDIQGSAERNK